MLGSCLADILACYRTAVAVVSAAMSNAFVGEVVLDTKHKSTRCDVIQGTWASRRICLPTTRTLCTLSPRNNHSRNLLLIHSIKLIGANSTKRSCQPVLGLLECATYVVTSTMSTTNIHARRRVVGKSSKFVRLGATRGSGAASTFSAKHALTIHIHVATSTSITSNGCDS